MITATTTKTTHLAVEVVSENLVEVPCSGQELVLGALDLSSEGPHVAQRLRRGQPLHRHLALRGTKKENSGDCGRGQVYRLKTSGSASMSDCVTEALQLISGLPPEDIRLSINE